MSVTLSRILIAIAAALLAAATGLGAVASHALQSALDAAELHAFETAVDYQFVHALGLLGLAIYGERRPGSRLLGVAGILLVAGIVMFCGGVYTSSLEGPGWISSLAPAGGSGLIVAWLVAAFAVLRELRPD